MQKFIGAIESDKSVDPAIDGRAGSRTVKYMQDIVKATKASKQNNK